MPSSLPQLPEGLQRVTRHERITVLIVLGLTVLFVIALVSGWPDQLNGQTWFGSGANLIQWTSGIGMLLAIATAVSMHYSRTCAAHWYCLRRGEHPVDGTLQKVCHCHHTIEGHENVYLAHGENHDQSGRLGFGESHTLVERSNPLSGGPSSA